MKTLLLCFATICVASPSFAILFGPKLSNNAVSLITSHPQSQSICEGKSTSFSVIASGSMVSYKWKVDVGFGFWELTSSATFSDIDKAELKVNSVTPQLNNYKFKCIVTFSNGDILESNVATLTVLNPPAIDSHPSSAVTCQGSDAVFEVVARGSALTFQWQEDRNDGGGFKDITNSFPYAGVNTSSLQISVLSSSFNSYRYRCVIGGICEGSTKVISNVALLTVNPLVSIQKQPKDASTCSSKPLAERTVVFKVEALGSNLIYQWQVDAGFGFVSPPTTPIHTGINSPELTVSNITGSFSGYVYRCVITSSCGGTLTSASAVLTVNDNNPSQPGDFTKKAENVIAGSDVEFSVAPLAGVSSYDWTYKNSEGNIIPGVTIYGNGTSAVTLSFSNNATSGILSVCAVNGCGLSVPRSLALNVESGVLPLRLISYQVDLNHDGSANVRWSTAQEDNCDRFEVLHSTNGSQFAAVGVMQSKGNKQAIENYSFIHSALSPGVNYYKLMQYDKDGKSKELGLKSVKLSLITSDNYAYPNPLTGSRLTIKYDTAERLIPVSISSLTGQTIFRKEVEVVDNLLLVELESKPLPGVYLLKVGERNMLQKVIVN